jgi:hypothetical protein
VLIARIQGDLGLTAGEFSPAPASEGERGFAPSPDPDLDAPPDADIPRAAFNST